MIKISKKKFNEAINKYPPSNFIRFGFKYFSKNSNKFMLKNIVVIILTAMFIIGFICNIFNYSIFVKISTISFTTVIGLLTSYLFLVIFLNKIRINKIRKYLGDISYEEYIGLIEKYEKIF